MRGDSDIATMLGVVTEHASEYLFFEFIPVVLLYILLTLLFPQAVTTSIYLLLMLYPFPSESRAHRDRGQTPPFCCLTSLSKDLWITELFDQGAKHPL